MEYILTFSMGPNERVKYLNESFTTILSKFEETKRPVEKI